MDDEGNLIGVTETTNFDEREIDTVEATQQRNQSVLENAMNK
jgi:hypothetical protein